MVDSSGDELLEPAVLEEIEPNKKYYMQQQKKNEFYPTVFHPSVTWSTIQELHNTGKIWRLKQ